MKIVNIGTINISDSTLLNEVMEFLENKGYILETGIGNRITVYNDINKIAPHIPTNEDIINMTNKYLHRAEEETLRDQQVFDKQLNGIVDN